MGDIIIRSSKIFKVPKKKIQEPVRPVLTESNTVIKTEPKEPELIIKSPYIRTEAISGQEVAVDSINDDDKIGVFDGKEYESAWNFSHSPKTYSNKEIVEKTPLWTRDGKDKEKTSLFKQPKKLALISGLAVSAAIFILLSTVLAKTTVTIKPKVEDTQIQNVTVVFDTSASQNKLQQKTIPAERLDFNKTVSVDFQATARQNLQQKAQGKVQIYNSYSSSPQKLIASTRFLTGSGIMFRLASTIIVPGAKIQDGKIVPQSIGATLVADQPGVAFNVTGETKLNIPGFKDTPKYATFYAVAPDGLAGGFQGEAMVVSKDDLKNAQLAATKQVYDQLKDDMDKKIPADFKLLDGLRTIQITKVDLPIVGSKADMFTVTAYATGRVLVFREADSISLTKDLLLADQQSKEYVDGSARLNYEVKNTDFDKGKSVVAITGNIKIRDTVSEQDLADNLKGLKEGSMIEFLKSRPDLSDFSLSFFPPWVSSAPSDPQKINFISQKGN